MLRTLGAALLTGLVALAASAGTSQKVYCEKKAKTIEKCCCVEKNGKLVCTLTGEKLDACCCKPAKK